MYMNIKFAIQFSRVHYIYRVTVFRLYMGDKQCNIYKYFVSCPIGKAVGDKSGRSDFKPWLAQISVKLFE